MLDRRPLAKAMPVLAAAALAAGAAGCGASTSASSGSSGRRPSASKPSAAVGAPMKVALSEWKVAPGASAAAGPAVTFDVRNAGRVAHEMVVIKTDRKAAKLGRGARVPEGGNVGETGDLRPGASKTLKLKLGPGHYALICNLPGHYSSGMHTDLTVR